MAGIADLLHLGQPNPGYQLAQALQGQQPQPQGPQGPAAQPGDAGGAPAAPGAPPAPGTQVPQALQSTPDMSSSYQQLAQPNLMQLYLQMQNRQSADNMFNRGIALIAANHAGNPGAARMIMDSVSGGPDAGQTVGNLMSLYQAQQGMAGQQVMLQHADEIAARTGYSPDIVRSMILAGRGSELIQDTRPTELQKNYDWAHRTYAANHPGATPEEIDAGAQAILLGGGAGGGAGSEIGSMNLARSKWLSDPNNQGKPPPGYMTDLTKWKLYQADLSDAKGQFDGLNTSLDKFINDMGEVANNPNLDKITGSTGNILSGVVEGLTPGEVNDLKVKMSGLGAQAKDMASRGGPKGVGQNIKTLGSSPEDFTNAKLTDYRDAVIAPRMKQALTVQADARGAAGLANSPDTPGYLQHYMNKMYQSGGELDIGGAPRKLQPDTGSDGKPLPAPTKDVLDDFYTALEHRGPQYALQKLKDAGYDTSALR